MALNIDDLPLYDPITPVGGNALSDIWFNALANLIMTLQGYLSSNGVFIPPLTQAQIDGLNAPVNGQMVYNSTTNKLQAYENGAWANLI